MTLAQILTSYTPNHIEETISNLNLSSVSVRRVVFLISSRSNHLNQTLLTHSSEETNHENCNRLNMRLPR